MQDDAQPIAEQKHFTTRLQRQSVEYLAAMELETDDRPHVDMPETLAFKVRLLKEVFLMEEREHRQKKLGAEKSETLKSCAAHTTTVCGIGS